MPTLLAFPVLGLLTMLQSAVLSRMQLLHGASDLLLLALAAWSLHDRVSSAWRWALVAGIFFSIVSSLPMGAVPLAYILTTGLALVLKRYLWQAPLLAMFMTTFAGTLLVQVASIAARLATGVNLPIIDTLNLITLPSLLLNMLLALPVYILITDLANWVHPREMEV